MINYNAVNDKIVAKKVKLEVKQKGSIIIPETAQANINQDIYQAISVGSEVKTVKKGDLITCLKHNAMDFKMGDDVVTIIPEDAVYFILDTDLDIVP